MNNKGGKLKVGVFDIAINIFDETKYEMMSGGQG